MAVWWVAALLLLFSLLHHPFKGEVMLFIIWQHNIDLDFSY